MKVKYDLIGQCKLCGGNLTSDHICRGFTSKHPAEQTLSLIDTVEAQKKEIESLRLQLDLLSQISVIRERDECKRRAKMMWNWIDFDQPMFKNDYPEAADWFE